MVSWTHFRKIMLRYFSESKWYTIVTITALYSAIAWGLLRLAGEDALTSNIDFLYWMAVTASTVGYGDLSPVTNAGKLIVAFYVIPVGLSIFAMVVGRIAAWVSFHWQRGLLGMKPIHVDQHILVIGWNEHKTLLLLDLLLKEREALADKPDIVLCVKADIQNPLPDKIEFVKVESFNRDEDMDKARVAQARTILIDNPQDDVTLTTALYCASRNPDAHKVAYFTDDTLVPLLQKHCPKVECTPSVAVEMLAKAAFDPGSSALHHDLISVGTGQAQFSVDVPADITAVAVEQLFKNFKKQYNAIFIGYAPGGVYKKLVLNPDSSEVVNGGDKVFYIAEKRLSAINWTALGEI